MAAKADLWGDIGVVNDRTPLSILREQAALLGSKTQNLIEANVETQAAPGGLRHAFNLVVPVLDHYTYELFSIWHGVTDLYPVETRQGARYREEEDYLLRDEEAFTAWLSKKLSSPETKKVLGNLLAQARS